METVSFSSKIRDAYRFDNFEASAAEGSLYRDGVRIRIQDLPFQMLLVLLERAGDMVTKEELRDRLWGTDTFVEVDQNLYVIVGKLRETLGDSASAPRYIKTVSGRGYRFICNVISIPAELFSKDAEVAALEETGWSPTGRDATALETAPDTTRPSERTRRWTMRSLSVLAVSLALIAVLFTIAAWWYRHRTLYRDTDTIAVGPFSGSTSSQALEKTLSFTLLLKLQESPYLRLLPQQKIQVAEGKTAVSQDTQVSYCASNGGRLLLNGRLVPLGSGFRVQLAAWRCSDGHLLATESADADSETSLLTALDTASENMRRRLGEPESSLQRYNMALVQATTGSLAALKSFADGEQRRANGDDIGAIPYYKIATDLDPQFALAFARLGTISLNTGEMGLGKQYLSKAFALRERTTDRERLYIAGSYYLIVTGEIERSVETYELWHNVYPNDWIPANNLAALYSHALGQPDKGIAFAQTAIRQNPGAKLAYASLAIGYLEHGDYKLLAAMCHDPATASSEFATFHMTCYRGAAVRGDNADMEREMQWAHGRPQESYLLAAAAQTSLIRGQWHTARKLFAQAKDNAKSNKLPEVAASIELGETLSEAEMGTGKNIARRVADALLLTPETPQLLGSAALVLARAGEQQQALAKAGEASKQAKLDTMLNDGHLASVRALVALERHDPGAAIEALEVSRPVEFSTDLGLSPLFYRGLAYQAEHQPERAAAEFRRLLDHRDLAPDSLYVALAQVKLAEALRLSGDAAASENPSAAAKHQWRLADADFPPLQSLNSHP